MRIGSKTARRADMNNGVGARLLEMQEVGQVARTSAGHFADQQVAQIQDIAAAAGRSSIEVGDRIDRGRTARTPVSQGPFEDVCAGAARQRVVAGTAIEHVVAGAAIERVIAGAAFKTIIAGAARQRVGTRGAHQGMVAGSDVQGDGIDSGECAAAAGVAAVVGGDGQQYGTGGIGCRGVRHIACRNKAVDIGLRTRQPQAARARTGHSDATTRSRRQCAGRYAQRNAQ